MQEHKVWIKLAEEHLQSSTIILEAEEPIVPTGLYHAFSCIEMSLKGYLLFRYRSFGKSWDLIKTLEACSIVDRDFETLRKAVTPVNAFDQSSCYPTSRVHIPKPTEAQKHLRCAARVLKFVKKKAKRAVDITERRIAF